MSKKLIDQFLEMVKIPSESGNEKEMIEYLEKEFQELAGKTTIDKYGNLIVKIKAKRCEGKKPILLSCHADTVKPGVGIKPVIKDGVIRSDGSTILGADDKAGISELLEAIRVSEIHPPLEIAISRQEEVGLLGVKNMDYNLISAKKGFLLDNDVLDTIVIGGPSYFAIDVQVRGKAAHAGMEPEKGINAILAASKAISHLNLGRLDEETTANVGVINGGIIRNGVPDSATFLAECRSLKHAKAEKLANEMISTIAKQAKTLGAEVEIKVDNLCKAVDIPEDSWTVQTARKALQKIGIEAKTAFITGFTDASIYNNKGIEMAVIGIGARQEHSTEEHIYIKDMEKAVNMLLEIFKLSAN